MVRLITPVSPAFFYSVAQIMGLRPPVRIQALAHMREDPRVFHPQPALQSEVPLSALQRDSCGMLPALIILDEKRL
jgi:hypothetical protein